MKKWEFIAFLRQHPFTPNWTFTFVCGNDERRTPYHVRRTSSYEFRAINNENRHSYPIKIGSTGKPVYDFEMELREKYGKWVKEFYKNFKAR